MDKVDSGASALQPGAATAAGARLGVALPDPSAGGGNGGLVLQRDDAEGTWSEILFWRPAGHLPNARRKAIEARSFLPSGGGSQVCSAVFLVKEMTFPIKEVVRLGKGTSQLGRGSFSLGRKEIFLGCGKVFPVSKMSALVSSIISLTTRNVPLRRIIPRLTGKTSQLGRAEIFLGRRKAGSGTI